MGTRVANMLILPNSQSERQNNGGLKVLDDVPKKLD